MLLLKDLVELVGDGCTYFIKYKGQYVYNSYPCRDSIPKEYLNCEVFSIIVEDKDRLEIYIK